jgi:transposase
MRNCIMIGCDLHDRSMLLKVAVGRDKPRKRSFENTLRGRSSMIRYLRDQSASAGGADLIFAYEASGQGFGLYDELTESGIECHVLAPTCIERSPRQKKQKTDEKDAEDILKLVRGYVLAGNELPSVWIPDTELRDDREVVRARLDVAEKQARIKTQIQCLLKRNGICKPSRLRSNWTQKYFDWLRELIVSDDELGPGSRSALRTLVHQLVSLEGEIATLDAEIEILAQEERYRAAVEELDAHTGVALLTAMVFLTELGDLSRFCNRRQIGSYLGLVPSSNETGGPGCERKGHITRQGPHRVRKVLCQATWAWIRHDLAAHAAYERLKAKNPKKAKIAVVAFMRKLAIRLWHRGLEAKPRAEGGAGPPTEAAA